MDIILLFLAIYLFCTPHMWWCGLIALLAYFAWQDDQDKLKKALKKEK